MSAVEDLSDEALRRRARRIELDDGYGCSGRGIMSTAFEELQEVRDAARAESAEELAKLRAAEADRLGYARKFTPAEVEIAKLRDRVAELEGDQLAACAALRDITGKHVALELEASQCRRDKERAEESFQFRYLVIAEQERVLEKLCIRISCLREGHEHIAGMNTDAGVIAAEFLRVDDMQAKATRPEDQYLILKVDNEDVLSWWGPTCAAGFTQFLRFANRYTLEEARAIVRGSNRELIIVPVASAYEQARLVVYSDQRHQLREAAPHVG